MPYKSDAQRRFFHSPGAQKAGITPAQVKDFDQASKGMNLPPRASAPKAPQAPKAPNAPKSPKAPQISQSFNLGSPWAKMK